MSDADRDTRDWRIYIQDMIAFSQKVLSYTEGLDQEAFIADERTYDATLRNLELIGEAASHIPSEVRETHPRIQWRDIIATRNRVAHGYLGIDDDVVWDIIKTDIPSLLPALQNLLDTTREDPA
jgi:uncharacterized protein with HEPN domain